MLHRVCLYWRRPLAWRQRFFHRNTGLSMLCINATSQFIAQKTTCLTKIGVYMVQWAEYEQLRRTAWPLTTGHSWCLAPALANGWWSHLRGSPFSRWSPINQNLITRPGSDSRSGHSEDLNGTCGQSSLLRWGKRKASRTMLPNKFPRSQHLIR